MSEEEEKEEKRRKKGNRVELGERDWGEDGREEGQGENKEKPRKRK